MFNYLVGIFIKNKNNLSPKDIRLSKISLSSIIGIIVNIVLFVIKITLGLLAASTAIINDAFNNLSDSVVSIMALLGSNISKKPADYEHPFGHGRVEYVITLLVSILIMYVSFMLFINSIESFNDPSRVGLNLLTLIILTFSILLKVYIYFLNKKLYIDLDSTLNQGVMLDARNDIMATLGIVIAAIIQKYVSFDVDAIMGLILAVFVFLPGFSMFNDTIKILLGKRVDKNIEDKIKKIILEGKLTNGYHDLQIHDYGKGVMAGSCHVEVPANLSVEEVHNEIDRIENEILEKTNVKLTIHMDPTYCIIDTKKEGNLEYEDKTTKTN